MSKIIGIDLGTTYSCVAVWHNNAPQVIPNENGQRTTASCVSFVDSKIIVGDKDDPHAIHNVKRFMGHTTLFNNYTPEKISSFILSYLKKCAENYLLEPVTKAIITVPAYFNDAQRQATVRSGKEANLEVVQLINEPTAAAMAYGLDKSDKTVLIYDLGGGTLDVSLLTIKDGIFQVKGTSGHAKLGGIDFDTLLAEYCATKVDISTEDNILLQCEEAKKQLSILDKTTIYLINGVITITRVQFEKIIDPLVKKCMSPIHDVLSLTGIRKNEIDDIVLIGGSTRIPIIRTSLETFFRKKLCIDINPDEAVAIGSSIFANTLINKTDMLLIDVTSMSIGVEVFGGKMEVIIPRSTTIPVKKDKIFTSHSDNVKTLTIKIYEGEKQFTKDNNFLSTIEMTGLTMAKRGVLQIKVTFSIDVSNVLTITCVDVTKGGASNLITHTLKYM